MNKGAKKTLIKLIVAVPLMFAFGFALVPLYDVFCEVTGLNGKVFQSEHSDELVVDDGRQISLQFISTNNDSISDLFGNIIGIILSYLIFKIIYKGRQQ